jgi:hypothetical protein
MSLACSCCGALHFPGEKSGSETQGRFSQCCQKGKIELCPLQQAPALLHDYLTGYDRVSMNYQENIIHYNASMAFASREAQLDEVPGRGPYCMRIHGNIYHKFGGLNPGPGQTRKYAQLYILDSEQATRQRLNVAYNVDCLEVVMNNLDAFIRLRNPYFYAFHQMHTRLREEQELAGERELRIFLCHRLGEDPRRYNHPVNQADMAVVFTSDDGLPPANAHLRVYPTTGRNFQIMHWCDPNRDPMVYPLLFPYGEQGNFSVSECTAIN